MAVSRATVESLEKRALFAVTPMSVGVNVNATFQEVSGFGAGMISWLQKDEYKESKLFDNIVGDMGASAARAAVWPNFEKANDNNDPEVFNWSKFDTNSLANTMRFFQQMKARGASTFVLSVWTPPAWMKTNQSHNDGGHLRPDDRAEFAEYLAAYIIRAKQAFDIDITAVSIQNEPFLVEDYESTLYSPAEMRETVRAVTRKFVKEGINTSVLIPEEVFSQPRWRQYVSAILADPELKNANVGFASHYMSPDNQDAQSAVIAGTGKKNWYLENGNKGPAWSGGLSLSNEIDDALRRGSATSYLVWQFAGTNANDKNFALVLDGKPNGKYQAMKHYSRYVRPGAVRVDTNSTNPLVRVTAFKHPTSQATTIVLTNNNTDDAPITLDLKGSGLPTSFKIYQSTSGVQHSERTPLTVVNGKVTLTMPASSMVTLYSGPDYVSISTGVGAPAVTISRLVDAGNTYSLREAALDGDLAKVNSLLASGQNPNLGYSSNGWTALFTGAASPYAGGASVVDALLKGGANPLLKDKEGLTALHVAASNQIHRYGVNPDVARQKIALLLAAGIPVDALDNKGRSALHYAAMMPKIDGDGAGLAWNTSVVRALLDAGADKNRTDIFGKTPPDYAKQEENIATVALLSGTVLPPTISGIAFVDSSQNGTRESGEAYAVGRMIYVDSDNDGVFDQDEPTQTVDATGVFKFTLPGPGTYTLRQVLPPGWTQTGPANGAGFTATVASGQNVTGANFGSILANAASLSGTVFDDANASGTPDQGESGRAMVTIYLDADNDSVFDPEELFRVTDQSGNYFFDSVPVGETYTVRPVLASGATLTTPPSIVTILPNTTNVPSPIGIQQTVTPPPQKGSITGLLFGDDNNDGVRNGTEPVAGGKIVWIDLDQDGKRDTGEPAVTTPSSGLYTFSNLNPGTYQLRRVFPSGYRMSGPTFPSYLSVTVAAGQAVTGADIGSTNKSPGGPVTPPPGNTGSITGRLFGDADNDGFYDAGEALAAGRRVWLDLNGDGKRQSTEPSVLSDNQGVYTFTGLAAKDYRVRREFPSGYRMSGTNPGYRSVTVASGQAVTGADIGSTNRTV